MTASVAFLGFVLVATVVVGLWWKRRNGVVRSADEGSERLTSDDLGVELGTRATLVQFSSAFCQPCRATRTILGGVAEDVAGVVHVDIDAEKNLELVRRLDIRRTPTVLVLDATGVVRKRASGQPRKADVIAALGEAIP